MLIIIPIIRMRNEFFEYDDPDYLNFKILTHVSIVLARPFGELLHDFRPQDELLAWVFSESFRKPDPNPADKTP